MSGKHLLHIVLVMLLAIIGCGAGWWYGWPVYLVWSARQDLASGNFERAEKTLGQLLGTVPNQAETHFLHAQILRRLKRYGDAQSALAKALSLGLPTSDERQRESALIEAGLDFRRGAEGLLNVWQSTPDDLEAVETLADGYANLGRWSEAEPFYARWLDIEPDNDEALFGRARARAGTEHTAPAIADLQDLLRRSPEHFHARLVLGNCYLSDARMDDAEAELTICRQLRPDRAEPLVGLAQCATDRGDLDSAQKLLSEAKDLDQGSVLVLHELGDHYLLRQRYDLAEATFHRLARLDTHDKQAFLKLAQAFRKNGKEELARKAEARYRELDAEELRRENSGRGPR